MKPERATPEQALASTYLDGDVTAVERAQVDASPELLALVASMRDNAAMIAKVAAPSAATREAGVAAALAEFDARGAESNLAILLPVSLASRRRWPTTVLTAAAAAVLVGVAAVSVLRNTNDSKSESASHVTDNETTKRADPGDPAGGALPATAGDEIVLESVASALAINDPQDLLTLTPPAPPIADTSPVADTTAGAGESTPSPQRIDSYNVDAIACMSDTQVFLADISYRGMLAIAVRDTVTGVTEAIDGNCTVLARVKP